MMYLYAAYSVETLEKFCESTDNRDVIRFMVHVLGRPSKTWQIREGEVPEDYPVDNPLFLTYEHGLPQIPHPLPMVLADIIRRDVNWLPMMIKDTQSNLITILYYIQNCPEAQSGNDTVKRWIQKLQKAIVKFMKYTLEHDIMNALTDSMVARSQYFFCSDPEYFTTIHNYLQCQENDSQYRRRLSDPNA